MSVLRNHILARTGAHAGRSRRTGSAVLGSLIAASFLFAASAGCIAEPEYRPNQIAFGVVQAADASGFHAKSGASFSVLSLGKPRTFLEEVREPGRVCFLEDLDLRPGNPPTDRGTASFQGGSLPPAGLRLDANGPAQVQHDGPAWSTSDVLTFESNGFAAPPIRRMPVPTPSLDLRVHEPAPDSTMRRGDPLVAKWAPIDGVGTEQVEFSLRASDDDRGLNLRCYFDPAAGSGTMPASSLMRFLSSLPRPPDGAARFRATIALHRQTTLYPADDWRIVVVATMVHGHHWLHLVD